MLAKLRGFDGHRHLKTILTFLRRRILCKAIGKYSNFKAYINGIFLYQVWLKTPFPKFVDHPASLFIIYIDGDIAYGEAKTVIQPIYENENISF